MRQLILVGIVIVAMVAWMLARPISSPEIEPPQLTYVTTAHQLGVVGYRDPAGAISPDGTRFAYSEGRFVRVVPSGGGAPLTLAPGDGQIRYLTWRSNDTIMAEETGGNTQWWLYDAQSGERRPLWGQGMPGYRQFDWSADGSEAAGLITTDERGPMLLRFPATGTDPQRTNLTGPVSFPSFMSDGTVACVAEKRLVIPCGGAKRTLKPDVDVVGPIAFTAQHVYFASPSEGGMVALWTADLRTSRAHRVSSFSRDTYAPSIGGNTVVFKTQTYRTFLADVPSTGGATRQLTTFQSETPSFHPTQPLLAFTYGTWRRVLDDGKYPDIAQDIGVISTAGTLPAAEPSQVIAKSDSEDQAMAWSPNGKWIAFHTHREMSDDVWLRPSDGSQPDQRITFLGRGAEVGWPRWSPDGKRVLLDGANRASQRSVIYVIGVDQETGTITSELRMRRPEGMYTADITHAEWLGNDAVVYLLKEGPGRHAILTSNLTGGPPRVIHRFSTEHDFSGLGVSSDGKWVAFAAPATDGYYQIFKLPVDGKASPTQLTNDPSNKTQPAFSPDGARVAFTVWSYEAAFWSFRAP